MLRNRWFYVALWIVVGVTYWASGQVAVDVDAMGLPASMHQLVEDDPKGREFLNKEVDVETLRASLKANPGLAGLVSAWTLLFASVFVAGLWLSLEAAWKRRRRVVSFEYLKAPARWSLGEAWGVIQFVAAFGMLLPLVHRNWVAAGVTWMTDLGLWSVAAMLILEVWLIAVVWAFARSRGDTLGQALGLSLRTAPKAIGQGLRGYVMLFPWVVGLLWLTISFAQQLGIEPPVEPVHEL